MTGSKPAQQQPTTLMQAHEALVRIRPSRDASLEAWQSYYQRSAALYAEIAEIDRGHHHEALYWAEREREKAKEVADLIKKGATSWDPFS
ncbi:MAG: hypothetical protein M3Y48_22025 [Actinomycetota bacterium]|nr:hypothetical protein [Actinomycetota bacterium]